MNDVTGQTLVTISGGGMAQIENAIGVLRAIRDKRGDKFDMMYGTSAGAIVSSAYMSCDQDIVPVEETVRNTDPEKWFKIRPIQAIKSVFHLSNYIADNTGFKNYLVDMITPEAIEKVRVAVTEMPDGRVGRSLMLDGRPSHVLASMSFQKIFPPVVWDGIQHGDGGINNLCPLPKYMDIARYKHIYVILAAPSPIMPTIKKWKFLDELFEIIDRTMDRELAQIKEFALDEAPNVTVIQPPSFDPSASLLKWSDGFKQIDLSYEYACSVLDNERK